jgi:predicted RNA-binding Zn-ribbon protein involved in translation (DUF1610 family)
MPGPLRFAQTCDTCGRWLDVRIELLGRTVACPHCQAEFVARCQETAGAHAGSIRSVPDHSLDERIARLLEVSSEGQPSPG